MQEARNIMIYLSLYYKGEWDSIYNELKKRRLTLIKEEVDKEVEKHKNAICVFDPIFPKQLKNVDRPPFVLFYKGNLDLLDKKYRKLSVVGSRLSTSYGEMMTAKIISKLEKDTVIVSGLARGIDYKAHDEAIKNNLKTIAFIGQGINYIYPKENEEMYQKIIDNGGLILSEYPDLIEPSKENFLFRNRLIAGLSGCTLLIESYARSGAYNTACYAAAFGKNVACVPGNAISESNTNKLIKDGAYLVESASDLSDLY